MKNYYEVLGLQINATNEEIKYAYRKLSLKFHPDKNDGDKYFEEWSKKVNEAYEILGNKEKKEVYDNQFINFSTQQNSSTNEKTSDENYSGTEFETLLKIQELTSEYLSAKKNQFFAQYKYDNVRAIEIENKFSVTRILLIILLLIISAFGLKKNFLSIIGESNLNKKSNEQNIGINDIEKSVSSKGESESDVIIPENAEKIELQYTVKTDKVYFHNSPDDYTITKKYLVEGDIVLAKFQFENYVYVEYKRKMKKTKGWININDLTSTNENIIQDENENLTLDSLNSNP